VSQPLRLVVRAATRADVPALNLLIAASARALSVGFYTPEQIDAAVKHVFGVDTRLVDDGTYYVVETEGQLVGCGGWSRQGALYGGDQRPMALAPRLDPATEPARIRAFFVAPGWERRGIGARLLRECRAAAEAEGFTSLELMATLPGVPLYARYGFREVERVTDRMPSGVTLEFVRMRA
jgi:GNAT superfamily N-acetyltransferase